MGAAISSFWGQNIDNLPTVWSVTFQPCEDTRFVSFLIAARHQYNVQLWYVIATEATYLSPLSEFLEQGMSILFHSSMTIQQIGFEAYTCFTSLTLCAME